MPRSERLLCSRLCDLSQVWVISRELVENLCFSRLSGWKSDSIVLGGAVISAWGAYLGPLTDISHSSQTLKSEEVAGNRLQ